MQIAKALVRAMRGMALAASSLLAAPGLSAAPPTWNSTRSVQVSDPQYQMVAYTLAVPTGWKFAGAIVRDPWCHSLGGDLKFTAQSPDGLTSLARIPGVQWSWSSSPAMRQNMQMQHCAGIDIDSAAGFLVNIAIPNLHPTAKIVAVLPLLPEGQAAIAAQLASMRQQNEALARQYGQPPQKLTLDGARVRVSYVLDGQPVEEMVITVVQCTESQMPALNPQPAFSQRGCTGRGLTIIRAAAGHLDELMALPQFAVFYKALQVNPEWQRRLSGDQQATFQRILADSNREFQKILAQGRAANDALLRNGEEARKAQADTTRRAIAGDRAQQAAVDAAAHATALHSLDRAQYKNPANGQTLEISADYNHQWLSSDGSTLIQTNDHSLDPNGLVYPVSQSWTELVPR